MKKILLSALVLTLGFGVANAQEEETPSRFNLSGTFETSHLWRGLEVSEKPTLSTLISYDLTKDKALQVGVWGGMAVSNEHDDASGVAKHYKEIDYFIQYSKGGATIGVWDLYNMTSNDGNIFDYDKDNCYHLIDLRTSYQFKEDFPLRLEADVLLYGLGDQNADKDQRYSTYVEASYPFVRGKKVDFKGFIGAGFAFNPGEGENSLGVLTDKTHLYGDGKNSFDIVNIGFTANKKVKIFDTYIPISATTLWNPSLELARVQLAVNLF